MASNASKPPPTSSSRASFAGIPSNNGSILLEKNRFIARRSTPDSDVVASSDDEPDRHTHDATFSNPLPPRPGRRSSWLSDVQALPPRRSSFASVGPLSPGATASSTTSAESWGVTPASGGSRVGSSPFTWGNAIWNSESRKEPPARLTEVLPSPTSAVPPTSSPLFNESEAMTSSATRDQIGESTIPFAIPLHPTPKTYRSQSYSVGQLDPDSNPGVPGNAPTSYFAGRGRSNQPSGLQHRPSRPSMLSELSHEGTSLDRVREVDDDDESTSGSQHGVQLSTGDTHIVEQLARENAMLRQASATHQLENMRLRSRAATTNAVPGAYGLGPSIPGTNHLIQESVPEESDYAIDELEEMQALGGNGASGRRYSEYSVTPDNRSYAPLENRKLENLKKGHWQSSLGFGGLGEGQQSRRHSFADIPARNGSISSVGEHSYGGAEIGGSDLGRGLGGRRMDMANRPSQADNTAAYFATTEHAQRTGQMYSAAAQAVPLHHQAYLSQGPFGSGRTQSPMSGSPRSLQHASPHIGLAQPRHDQLLCVVTFKCCRSEIFYIQEGTGLEVKKGDMVIVEADRGTDLGTIAHTDVTWTEAKQRKEQLAQEHYKWLMLFSRHSDQAEGGTGLGHGGLLSNHGTSAVGGMGPQGGQRGLHETSTADIKPKLIKRLAQNHEIQSLRDKEGNEAKAKRVCQQKVVEHRLHMEVLDAEFQVDWKKLTFYYFADAYINFNSLVTDLFKIYKTRIWMSAINPASFASPSAGLPPPGVMGAVPVSLAGEGLDHHKAQEAQVYGVLGPHRGLQFGRPAESGLDNGAASIETLPPGYGYGLPAFGHAQRQPPASLAEYGQAMHQSIEGPTEFRPIDFGGFRQDPHRVAAQYASGIDNRSYAPNNDAFMNSFQGLSLGPR